MLDRRMKARGGAKEGLLGATTYACRGHINQNIADRIKTKGYWKKRTVGCETWGKITKAMMKPSSPIELYPLREGRQ